LKLVNWTKIKIKQPTKRLC